MSLKTRMCSEVVSEMGEKLYSSHCMTAKGFVAYKMLLKDTEVSLDTWKDISRFQIRKLSIMKMSVLPK